MEKKSGHEKNRHSEVLLICALTYQNLSIYKKTIMQLENLFGSIKDTSEEIDFSKITTFYDHEMGINLKKRIITFKNFPNIENLHHAKLSTILLEKNLKSNHKRQVNIDPGYLSLSKVILFSSKDFFHRVYIGNQIFGESSLVFSKKNKSFEGFYYTYKDFLQEEFIGFLNEQRTLFKKTIDK